MKIIVEPADIGKGFREFPFRVRLTEKAQGEDRNGAIDRPRFVIGCSQGS